MYQNHSKALGLYDELTNFLSQVNLYSGNKGLLDTHEFTKVLELFIGAEWSRQTGTIAIDKFLFALILTETEAGPITCRSSVSRRIFISSRNGHNDLLLISIAR